MTTTERTNADTTRQRTDLWWRDAVIYQVYVRSFADGDGDGMGDMAGLRSRLTYIRDLGVDAIWLNPFYPSPQADAGYDVSDYRDVDPRFGSLADFDAVLSDAHTLGLRVIVDIVPNHTSSEHAWFRAALAAEPESPERARYLFRDGRSGAPSAPPNNWKSVFGGPAWTQVDGVDGQRGQWYLHLFDTSQPDLDWTNQEVRAEFESILRFWLDRGVDGFRIDVAHGLAKDPALPDAVEPKKGRARARAAPTRHPQWDRDEVHDIYRQWRKLADSYPGDRAFVAEAWVDNPGRLARYVRPDELHTAFNFNYLLAEFTATSLRNAIDTSIAAVNDVGAPPTWVLSNHDVPRHVTRYGGGEQGVRRARAAALLTLALPGSAYVYQGEELGLPHVTDLPDEVRQDPAFARTGGQDGRRDGCRVPLPWSGNQPSYGFGPSDRSWLPQPAQWGELTAERQSADAGSMLNLYRDVLRLRRELPCLGDGALRWIDTEADVLAFLREPGFACVVNVGAGAVPVPAALTDERDVLLASGPLASDGEVPSETAIWYRLEAR